MDWPCLATIVVMGVITVGAVRHFRDLADAADERRGRTVEIITRVVEATGYQEPTRIDANDPLRTRLAFCGRWVEHGHAPECPWQAAVARVRPLEAAR